MLFPNTAQQDTQALSIQAHSRTCSFRMTSAMTYKPSLRQFGGTVERERAGSRQRASCSHGQPKGVNKRWHRYTADEESLNFSLWKASRDTWKLRMRCEDITNSWNKVTTKLLHEMNGREGSSQKDFRIKCFTITDQSRCSRKMWRNRRYALGEKKGVMVSSWLS